MGQRITLPGEKSGPPSWLTVIGVVANAKQYDGASDPDPEMYLAALQSPDFLGDSAAPSEAHMSYITLVVRTCGNTIATPYSDASRW